MHVTVTELMDLGWWNAYCAYAGYNANALRDGKFRENTIVELDNDFLRERHGLLPMAFAQRVTE